MNAAPPPDRAALAEARAVGRTLARYRGASFARSTLELAVTFGAFALLWVVIAAGLDARLWPALLLTVPAAGLLVRLFMIQHDCGHGAFFRNRHANDWVGRSIGVLTLTPYEFWRRAHALHHAGSGNLDRRGIGDITTLTVREFRALPRRGQLLYRLYRHPAVLFGVGPAYLFMLRHRLPLGLMRQGWRPWFSALATNVAIAALVFLLIRQVGLSHFLLIQLPITLLASAIGVWLFYVQHQFEDTFWAHDPGWNFHTAGLHGSSHYDLPPVLRWFTANIGIHHIHHLCSAIPFYRLPQVLADHPRLSAVGRLTLLQSLGCVRKALWDEDQRRLVSFRDLAGLAATEPSEAESAHAAASGSARPAPSIPALVSAAPHPAPAPAPSLPQNPPFETASAAPRRRASHPAQARHRR